MIRTMLFHKEVGAWFPRVEGHQPILIGGLTRSREDLDFSGLLFDQRDRAPLINLKSYSGDVIHGPSRFPR